MVDASKIVGDKKHVVVMEGVVLFASKHVVMIS